jgi:hypothetical protein
MQAQTNIKAVRNAWSWRETQKCNHCGKGAKYCTCVCASCGAPMFERSADKEQTCDSMYGARVYRYVYKWHGSAVVCAAKKSLLTSV